MRKKSPHEQVQARSSFPVAAGRPRLGLLEIPKFVDPISFHGTPDTQPLNSPSLSNIYLSIVIELCLR